MTNVLDLFLIILTPCIISVLISVLLHYLFGIAYETQKDEDANNIVVEKDVINKELKQDLYNDKRRLQMIQKIELITIADVAEFTDVVSKIDEDVTLVGKDEYGKDWCVNGKSLLANLLLTNGVKREPDNSAHNVDWNTIQCICDKDIYTHIKKWVVGSVME